MATTKRDLATTWQPRKAQRNARSRKDLLQFVNHSQQITQADARARISAQQLHLDTFNQWVAGSNPARLTTEIRHALDLIGRRIAWRLVPSPRLSQLGPV
ncbi:hypothetical protein [Pseudoruegeria sp. HB172150]|uniref:hypothetical protein n=1 Tax=Pseudoruegeria sp. HB172150 TaxID=2721164 RepID=UPI001C1322B7|nr:hypothetical protein [Pseudoruegeria sp. HB172150]